MQTVHDATQLHAKITNQIIASLEDGIVPWRKPWSPFGPPKNAVTKQPYTGANLWALHALGYSSNLFITDAQLTDLGGIPEEGAVAHTIINASLSGPISHNLYNVDDCKGIPASFLRQGPIELYPAVNACAALFVGMRSKPKVKYDGSFACYSVSEDTVYMTERHTYPSLEEYYALLLHQHVHATGHPERLCRPTVHCMAEYGNDPCAPEELVAELATGYLCAMLQIAPVLSQPNHQYIGRWLDKLRVDKEIFISASEQAHFAVEYLIAGNPIASILRCL